MEGYAKVADRMSRYPDLAIVRRFELLNIQNVLYLQAEIVDLEAKLLAQAQADARISERPYRFFSRDWRTLSAIDDSGEHNEQWKLWLALQDRLDSYNRALFHHSSLKRLLGVAEKHKIDILACIMNNANLPNDYLLGRDSTIWNIDSSSREDLVCLNIATPGDSTTRWMAKKFLRTYHELIGKRIKPPKDSDAKLWMYNDEHLQIPARVLGTVLASILPVLSIVALYSVESTGARLGLIALFTAVFSGVLAVMTPAKVAEIFAATAAQVICVRW